MLSFALLRAYVTEHGGGSAWLSRYYRHQHRALTRTHSSFRRSESSLPLCQESSD
jgi:hypothetical protein